MFSLFRLKQFLSESVSEDARPVGVHNDGSLCYTEGCERNERRAELSDDLEGKGTKVGEDDIPSIQEYLTNGSPVAELSGNEFQKDGVPLTDKVVKFWNENNGGKVNVPGVGDVIMDLESVKSDVGHKVGKAKCAAFAAVAEVMKNGKVYNEYKNWKGRQWDTKVIGAPITLDGARYVCEAIIKKDVNGEWRLYNHECEPLENAKAAWNGGGFSRMVISEMTDRERQIGAAKRYLSEVQDEAIRRHADGSVCKAQSAESCPFNKKAEEGDKIDETTGASIESKTELLAPNGQPSNLTERQWHQVRTPEFKAWFGDWENDPKNASKVVDENGEPKVMYHGSDGIRTEFKMLPGMGGQGAYFTSAFPEAADYVREKLGNEDLLEEECEGYITECFLNVRDENAFYGSHYGFGEIIVKASSPSQIKSATDNKGTFDVNSVDIRDEANYTINKYLRSVQDEIARGPKNETLTEHRKHCKAKKGECPFEQRVDKVDSLYAFADSDTSASMPTNEDIKDDSIVIVAGDVASWHIEKMCQENPEKMFLAIHGNHRMMNKIKYPNFRVLADEGTEVNGITVFGLDYVPKWNNRDVNQDKKEFSKIPENVDVLITHMPPHIEGSDIDYSDTAHTHCGSLELTEEILRKKPKIVLCGHIHGGSKIPARIGETTVYNCALYEGMSSNNYRGTRVSI